MFVVVYRLLFIGLNIIFVIVISIVMGIISMFVIMKVVIMMVGVKGIWLMLCVSVISELRLIYLCSGVKC